MSLGQLVNLWQEFDHAMPIFAFNGKFNWKEN